jgi:outer membrane protein insertion porin family
MVVEEPQVPVKCINPEDGSVRALIVLRFIGLSSFHELDAIKFIREAGVGLRPDRMPDAETADKAAAVLKKLLSTNGHVYAAVNAIRDEQFNSVTFQVTEGARLPLADIRFEGTKVFSGAELTQVTRQCLRGFKDETAYDQERFEYCLRNTANFIRSRGYLQAKFDEPKNDILGNGMVATVKVEEGPLYRLGQVTIEGADHVSAEEIRAMLPLSPGEVASGDTISKWLFEDLKKSYADRGYIEYTADLDPHFRKPNEVEGVVDLKVIIEEGERYTLRSIHFEGEQLPTAKLLDESQLKPGDVYNASTFAAFIKLLNQTGLYEPIDKDKDSDFRVNEEERLVSIYLKLRKRAQP